MSVFSESDPTDVVDAAPVPDPPISPPAGGGNLLVQLDDVDFSSCALSGSVTRRLNRPAQAQVKIPMDCAAGCSGPGQRLKVSFDGGSTLFFHGMVMDWELDGGEDTGYITMNAMDPMELWSKRVVRADDGDFSKPAGDGGAGDLFATYIYGPDIMDAVMRNTEGDSTAQGNPALSPPVTAEGPTFLDFQGLPANGCDLSGAPSDWPMRISELFNLLASTGCVDAVITPTDPGGGIMGDLQFYNGDYGTDLSGSVVFEYGTGAKNVRALRWNQDMSNMCNKLWYYGGPRVGTSADPAGDQHWCWNITGSDPDLAYPPGGDTASFNPDCSDINPTNNPLGYCRCNSMNTYGVRMEVQIFDGLSDNCLGPGSFDPDRWLYRRLWQAESWLRQEPRTLIHVTPTRGSEIGTFDIGDLVGVTIGSGICGGISGAQRVYQYTISWTEDGPFELSELQTSSDVGVETGA